MPSAEHCDRLVLNQSSLPKARQWLEWLAYHHAHLPHGHGWESCIADTVVGLHHHVAISARRLRGNPGWDLQGTMREDTEPLEPAAVRLCGTLEAYFPRNRDGRWTQTPDRFQKLMDCLYGALRQQIRLAREIDRMRDEGHIEVDVLVDRKNEVAVEQ